MKPNHKCKWKACKNTAAIMPVVVACHIFAGDVQASGGGIYNDGTLTITGTTLGNDIDVSYTRAGVHVRVDGQEKLFIEPVQTISVDAGEGDNAVQYRQYVTDSIALRIVAGAGEDDINIEFDLNMQSSSSIPTFAIDVDAGGGADRVKVKFPWLSNRHPQFDFVAEIRPGGGERFTPEIGDEVVVAMEYGDPSQPVIIGAVYNSGGAAGTQTPRLGLRNLARTLSATTEIQFTGGSGNDALDLHVDYSGVRVQKGAVVLEADFNEGDNRFDGRYIASSAGHMHLSSAIVAGDGNNTVQFNVTDYDFVRHLAQLGDGDNVLEARKGGSIIGYDAQVEVGHGDNRLLLEENPSLTVSKIERESSNYRIDLGDGENRTELRFGDGEHGRRPPVGERYVSATYRSGSGSDSILIRGEANQSTDAKFILEQGGENNQLQGEYVFGDGSTGPLPHRDRPVSSHAQVALLAPFDELDFAIVEQPPAGFPRRPAEFRVIVVGQGALGTLYFARTVSPLPRGSGPEFTYVPVRRTFTLHKLSADKLSVAISDDENRVSLDLADASVGRGILESDHIELYPVTWGTQVGAERQSWRAELEGLNVLGSAAVGIHIDGPGSSRTIFRDVMVNETATLSYDGIGVWDISDPVNRPAAGKKDGTILIKGKDILIKALELHDLRVDGLFTASLRSGGYSASFNAENIVLDRGVAQSTAVAIEELKAANEGLELELEGLKVLGVFATSASGALLSYIQDRVVTDAGAEMAVDLNGGAGNDVLLALLRGVAIIGDGRYRLTAAGGGGDDFGAVLARDLDPGAEGTGSMTFEVLDGDGNDDLALAVLAPIMRDAIVASVDGGPGFNSCFATSNVFVENCEHELDLKDILLLLRRSLVGAGAENSTTYTDEWSRSFSRVRR